jgi:hypothetical protein
MGEIGRRRVETELAWKFSVENLLAAYERAFFKRARAFSVFESAEPANKL